MSARPAHFAHSTVRDDRADWQPLAEHLLEVADLAAKRAAKFGAGDWGYVAGLLHDLGKYSDAFQARLEGRSSRVDHSTAGAVEAGKRWQGLARPLQFIVAGHHAGLANGGEEEHSQRSSLHDRLTTVVPDYSAHASEIELAAALPPMRLGWHVDAGGRSDRAGFQAAFFTRMLFSCLVDADYLNTEEFYDRVERRQTRRTSSPPLAELKPKLDAYLADLAGQADDTLVNRERAAILAACRKAAVARPGLFTLTVPTGGGKTLASLAFALEHAPAHEGRFDRVIYVVPYTSIIEQNAAVFREALGAEAVLEHHSAFVDDPKTAPEAHDKLRLAMENWDAAVVVTTAVQFFESLFADRPSRCRKLHNIAKSVVILDEAQTLPLPLLRPCVAALDELARNYGATVVLCTATQPALIETDDEETSFKGGFRDVREIAPEPKRLYQTFKRVTIEPLGELDDEELAERLRAHEQALCIVNTRAHARELYERIKVDDGCYHLSALMYPKHRSERLAHIRSVLAPGRRCLVVSTSLVEAGVDVDFPVVYRAEAGLDQIAQAAGRCNREGRLRRGEVLVFRPAGRRLLGEQNRRATAASGIFRRHPDPLALDAIEDFFREVYWSETAGAQDGLDKKEILTRLDERKGDLLFPFEAIARDFRLIEDGMLPILIAFDDEARRLLKDLETTERVGEVARGLQPYVVQVPPGQFACLCAAGVVQPVARERFGEQFWALVNESLYRPDIGLTWDDPTYRTAEANIIDVSSASLPPGGI
ncbi:MAG: CRISPR-associated helicase Cas3' [Geminicoccaceae bacterium]